MSYHRWCVHGAIRTDATCDRGLGGERRSTRHASAALLRRYHRTGDREARSSLIELHLPLVRTLARRYAHRGEGFEDLVQVGSIGLIEAIDRFDPGRGRDFAGFAIPTIAGEIKRHLRDRSTVVRIPRRPAELAVALRPAHEALSARLRRLPSAAELAEEAGVGENDVLEALETERARRPLELASGDGVGAALEATRTVEDAYATSEERLLLAAGFRTLAERERRILHLRFFEGLSQAEIAREVGLSQNQVSRLIRDSLARLRSALEAERATTGRSLVQA
jgi:RNA polymerase sigma-B factor